MEKIVLFQNEHLDVLKGPKLSTEFPLPHTSILQCPFYADALDADLFTRLEQIWENIGDTTSQFGAIYPQPRGWFFLAVKRLAWLCELQSKVMSVMAPLIDTSQIEPSDDIDLYTLQERDNFLRYGYRYVGESFRPHITLGYDEDSPDGRIDYRLVSAGLKLFAGKIFNYSKIVLYEAGPAGSLVRCLSDSTY